MFQSRLQQHAAEHDHLLTSIHELDYAPKALNDLASDLEMERQVLQTALEDSIRMTETQ